MIADHRTKMRQEPPSKKSISTICIFRVILLRISAVSEELTTPDTFPDIIPNTVPDTIPDAVPYTIRDIAEDRLIVTGDQCADGDGTNNNKAIA
uniref:Uncharacterized protein n=1 Tax=Ascaris lumbricoides TaxID=6252 RepID=A0A0M3HWT5_ASCLU